MLTGHRSTAFAVCRILSLWLLPAVAFTAVYVSTFQGSWRGGAEHLALVAGTALSILAISAAGATWLQAHDPVRSTRALHFGAIVLTATWLTFWCCAYLLMAVGLLGWGRIPTLSLLAAYSDQVPALLRVLDISAPAASFGVLGTLAIPLLLTVLVTRKPWRLLLDQSRKRDRDRSRTGRRFLRHAVMLVLIATTAAHWYFGVLRPHSRGSDEPVYLVLERSNMRTTQSIAISRIGDSRRQLAEDAARKEYLAKLAAAPAADARKPNVVLITVDALRPDHLSVYGYGRDTTPGLVALQQAGQLWAGREARSACAESACGLLSLTTGKQPHELLTSNFGLTEVLGLHGYERSFLLSGDHTNFYRLRDSYGPADRYIDGTSFPPGRMNDDYALLEQLRNLPPVSLQRPQFMFFHLMSVHGLGDKHPEHRLWLPAKTLYGTFAAPITAETMQLGRNSYDHGVRQVDWVIGQIIGELRHRKVLNADSILLITSDHGESLGEHGIKTHAESVFESVIRIPWIWVSAVPPYADLAKPAIQADFAPTVLRALGLAAPSHWSGVALQDAAVARRTYHAQPPFAAVIDYDGADPQGAARRKVVRDFRRRSTLVFDLRRDPQEQTGRPVQNDGDGGQDAVDQLIRLGYGDGG